MSPIEFAVWLLLGMLTFWLLGGFVARTSGLLLVLAGAGNMALDPRVGTALLIVLGAATWLAGHWHYRAPPRLQKPAGALRVLPLGAAMARPDRNWAVVTTSWGGRVRSQGGGGGGTVGDARRRTEQVT